jgi:predicted nucleic acid-binding protein
MSANLSSAHFFLDTNILVYAVDPSDRGKQAKARDCVNVAQESGLGVISYQVVHEWFNTVLRKSISGFGTKEAEEVYRFLVEPLWRVDSSRALIDTALTLFRDNQFSWWDSLIVSAALQSKCELLLSEDLQHGQKVGSLRIENPFLT